MAKTATYKSAMRILKTLEYLRNLPEPEAGESSVPVKPADLARYLTAECEETSDKTAKEILNAILDSDTGYCLDWEQSSKGRNHYRFKRTFSLEQLSLLSSIISSSMFLDEEQIKELLYQLKALTSDENASALASADHFLRPRMMNDNALNNLRIIHEAINTRRALRFLPCQMDTAKHLYYDKPIRGKKNKVQRVTLIGNEKQITEEDNPKLDSNPYIVCFPYALAWDNSRCYLVGGITDMKSVYQQNDNTANQNDKIHLWNFRVDRMFELDFYDKVEYRVPLSTPFYTPGRESSKNTPISNLFLVEPYMHSMFKMFTDSHIVQVTLRFKHTLTRVIVEKFGFDVDIIDEGGRYAKATVTVQVSKPFFGWLAGFSPDDLQLIAPQDVVDNYTKHLNEICNHYHSEAN